MFSVVKLKAKDLKKTPVDFLRAVGAVNEELKQAYPSNVYVSKKDYLKLEENVAKAFKKQYPYLSSKRLKMSVAMEMLNYAPNSSFEESLKDGYAIIETPFEKPEEPKVTFKSLFAQAIILAKENARDLFLEFQSMVRRKKQRVKYWFLNHYFNAKFNVKKLLTKE